MTYLFKAFPVEGGRVSRAAVVLFCRARDGRSRKRPRKRPRNAGENDGETAGERWGRRRETYSICSVSCRNCRRPSWLSASESPKGLSSVPSRSSGKRVVWNELAR